MHCLDRYMQYPLWSVTRPNFVLYFKVGLGLGISLLAARHGLALNQHYGSDLSNLMLLPRDFHIMKQFKDAAETTDFEFCIYLASLERTTGRRVLDDSSAERIEVKNFVNILEEDHFSSVKMEFMDDDLLLDNWFLQHYPQTWRKSVSSIGLWATSIFFVETLCLFGAHSCATKMASWVFRQR